MKTMNIIFGALVFVLVLGFFFNPFCGFHRIGSNFPDSDGCNTCNCGLFGADCTEKGCEPIPVPANCKSYFDGCNTCNVINGEIMGCTRMYCEEYEQPKCLAIYTEEEMECMSKGGKLDWYDVPNPESFCNMPTLDAGKECTDSSQCESYCQAAAGISGEGVTGTCYEWTETTECMNEVTNGTAREWCY